MSPPHVFKMNFRQSAAQSADSGGDEGVCLSLSG